MLVSKSKSNDRFHHYLDSGFLLDAQISFAKSAALGRVLIKLKTFIFIAFNYDS